MSAGIMPDDGPVRVGSVALPPGRRIFGLDDDAQRLWVTSEPMPDAGSAWRELADLNRGSGLVPIVLAFLDGGQEGRPWDEDELGQPSNLASVNSIDAASVLAGNWSINLPRDEAEFDEDLAGIIAPFGLRFPGLAPSQNHSLTAGEEVGFAHIRLLAQRSPRALNEAEAVAAELWQCAMSSGQPTPRARPCGASLTSPSTS